jgi:hypothetical protein
LESFHIYYNLICIFLYALLFAQNFILVKSGCYTQESEVLVCSAQFEHEATKMAGTNRGL